MMIPCRIKALPASRVPFSTVVATYFMGLLVNENKKKGVVAADGIDEFLHGQIQTSFVHT